MSLVDFPFRLTAREPLATLSWEAPNNVMGSEPIPSGVHHTSNTQPKHHYRNHNNNNNYQNSPAPNLPNSLPQDNTLDQSPDSEGSHHRMLQDGYVHSRRRTSRGGGRAGAESLRQRRRRLGSSSRQLCKLLKLHRRQDRMCRRGKGVPETLIKATRRSVMECQHQFRNERWNCSLGQYRQKILQKGEKFYSLLKVGPI